MGTIACIHSAKPRTGSTLTPRETEITALIAEGETNKSIADRLSIDVATVKSHLFRIFNKTGMSTRTELAVQYLTHRHEEMLAGLREARAA